MASERRLAHIKDHEDKINQLSVIEQVLIDQLAATQKNQAKALQTLSSAV